MKAQTGRFAVTCKFCKTHWTATLDPKAGQGLFAELGAMHHCERSDTYRTRVGGSRVQQDYQAAACYFKVEAITHDTCGSQHECGAKCRSAKGGQCECSCKGMFHGVAYAA